MATPSSLGIGEVRTLWGRSRYDPGAVDVERLLTELFDPTESDPFGGVLARAGANVAAADPDRVFEAVEAWDEAWNRIRDEDPDPYQRLLDGHLEDDGGPAVARTIAHLGTVDQWAGATLVGELSHARGRRLADLVEGVRRAAEDDPAAAGVVGRGLVLAVADATAPRRSVPDSVAYAGDRDRRGWIAPEGDADVEAVVDDAVAALVRALEADELDRLFLRTAIDDRDPGRRCCGVRVAGAAAGAGVERAVDRLPAVVDRLDDTFPAVQRSAMAAIADAAGTAPELIPDEVSHLLSVRGGEPIEAAATEALAALARADAVVFESLLELVADGRVPMSGLVGGLLGWPDHDRAKVAIAEAADAHPDLLADHSAAFGRLLDSAIFQAARCVHRAGPEHATAFESAVDPLFDAVDRYPVGECEPVFEALATLATAFRYVADGIVAGLAPDSQQVQSAAIGCWHLAETAPEALRSATADAGSRRGTATAVELLGSRLTDSDGGLAAARALARLGRRYPDAVEPLADRVATHLAEMPGTPGGEWRGALYELAGVLVHVDPPAFESVGLSVVSNPDADVAVPYVSSWCAEFPEGVDRVVGRVDDDAVGLAALRSIAVAAGSSPSAVAPVVDRLLGATDRRHWRERRAATRAVASAARTESLDPDPVADRLTELVYDPETEVRRWAAFGLGECLARGATPEGPAQRRLARVADSDDDEVAPVASLALVRADGRAAGGATDRLRRVATGDPRPIAEAAVRLLERQGHHAALADVGDSAADARIRRRAARILEG